MGKFRIFFCIGVFLVCFGVLETRLFLLQVKKGEYYVEKAEALVSRVVESGVRRGEIFITDRNENSIPIALMREFPMIYGVPREIKDGQKAAEILAPILEKEREDLEDVFKNKSSLFRLLAERAPEEIVRKVEELGISGVYKGTRQTRVYPFETLASQVVGFVGVNERYDVPRGLYGAEKEHEKGLAEGEGVKLTIDRNIQVRAEEIIENLMNRFVAKSASAIVAEPETGKILALANKPDFDPNAYGKYPIQNFTNQAIQGVYEPGSVMKPITMAMGIDLGVIAPETTYYDSGSVTINGETIKNWDLKARGTMTMTGVIEESVNTGAVFAAKRVGRRNFVEYLKKFGFGRETGIDLPDEVAGSVRSVERSGSQDIDLASASFGQGISATPMEIIAAFGSVANGGRLMRPYVNAALKPRAVRETIKKETADKVAAMMESAVEKAFVAALPGHRIAGKTGTAQIAKEGGGGYKEVFNHTYVGFGPVSDPRFVILIKLEEPQAVLAGTTVVPAFRELANFIISYYNIPPDKTSN